MFLTGFDSKMLNTLYVDKNLKYHGLIQAFSRTNRIVNEKKSQGNIVCFRNLKDATDDAIALFSNKEARDIILMKPYEDYIEQFNKAFVALMTIVPSVNSVDSLIDENEQMEFIKTFREIMRLKNVLTGFSEFNYNDLSMTEQQFEDYKSKYLDLYERVKHDKEANKVSILDEVDFELELIRVDEINVAYILRLLAKYRESSEEQKETMKRNIMSVVSGQEHLRSKRELIEEFIDKNLMGITDTDTIDEEFDKFLEEQKTGELEQLCEEESLDKKVVKGVVETYLYDQRKPLNDDISNTLTNTYPLLERRKVVARVLEKIMGHIEKFYDY
jgi:type I restriction enzyme R subunit